jgi:hypothetical protein
MLEEEVSGSTEDALAGQAEPEAPLSDAALEALPIIAWSRVWSPLVPDELRQNAWQVLRLPDAFEKYSTEFWSTFMVGTPSPRIPTLLHGALQREGAAVREDWMRVASHLGLKWGEVHLPPDQLGAACEVYACAISRGEDVLIEQLRLRYLLPWCVYAQEALAAESSPLVFLPEMFGADLVAIRSHKTADTAPDAAAAKLCIPGWDMSGSIDGQQ